MIIIGIRITFMYKPLSGQPNKTLLSIRNYFKVSENYMISE